MHREYEAMRKETRSWFGGVWSAIVNQGAFVKVRKRAKPKDFAPEF